MTSEQQPTAGVTREIELLWGLRETAKRGPKPRLSREEIVRTAVEVGDAEGLEAVSMQRVARELGYTTMSLYRYLESKEDLLTLMSDAAMSEPPPEPRSDGDWRAGVEDWCQRVAAQYRKHPWSVYVPQAGPPSGPNGIRWMESGLREISTSGLGTAESLQMMMLLTYSLRDVIRMEQDMARAAERSGIPVGKREEAWVSSLRRVLDPREFPTVARTFDEGTFEQEPPGSDAEPSSAGEAPSLVGELRFPIQRILDGIAAYVSARRDGNGGGGGSLGTGQG